MPKRIQRRRTKGWRMPPGAVYVGRPTMWGNRWQVGGWSNTLGRKIETDQEAVDLYRRLAWTGSHMESWVRENLRGSGMTDLPAPYAYPIGTRVEHVDCAGWRRVGIVTEAPGPYTVRLDTGLWVPVELIVGRIAEAPPPTPRAPKAPAQLALF